MGDAVYFGAYEQDNDTSNGKEVIEWKVLAEDSNKALVISAKALDHNKFNSTKTSVTWETCTLRMWLNGSFMKAAFSAEEQKRIFSTTVTADKNPTYNTSSGNNKTDKIFLLSAAEANKYFKSGIARYCELTKYASNRGAATKWWLRTTGRNSFLAAYVENDGDVSYLGDYVDNRFAVRPAMWISLK